MLCLYCKINRKNYLETAFDHAKATFSVYKSYVIGYNI